MSSKLFLTLFFFGWLTFSANSQDSLRYVQLSGIIMNEADNSAPVPGVKITNLTRPTVTLSNDKGLFSLVAVTGDRIGLSHLGMESVYITIPLDADSKVFETIMLDLDPTVIEQVVIDLPSFDELAKEFMAQEVEDDPSRALALANEDVFNILDTIEDYGAPILRFKNGEIQSSPITWFYENVYKKIKEKLPKPKRAALLPKWKDSDKDKEKKISN